MAVLSTEVVQERLKPLHGWTLSGGKIVRKVTLKDFVTAMAFVNRVAAEAEAAGHHPDIDIRYNAVRLSLVSHDDGGLTQKDFGLATVIEGLIASNVTSV
ncbi:MAG TPA: 4a-hydroxytetrahydrobiopterin dehydratase [Acidobacteriaceae bacterium]|nr:4a-hydroxytetrahydrobiopterin dehydratase [Acidobacteriaceae bacterium]